MKLRLIYGRSGSGKSGYIRKLCCEKRKEAANIIVIVPDQYTHQTELELIDAYGSHGLFDTEVLSIKRLAHRLKHIYGGASVIAMSNEGKQMIVRRLMDSMPFDEKTSVLRQASKTDVAKDVSHMISRFKQFSVKPEAIDECGIDGEKYKYTKAKLTEINEIYKAYTALENENYLDSEDENVLLTKNIYESRYFADKTVFIDGFDDMTRPELLVLWAIAETAAETTVTLPVDCVIPEERKILFGRSLTMAKAVEKTADEKGFETEKIWLTDNVDICPNGVKAIQPQNRRASGIASIEKHIFSRKLEIAETDGVKITAERDRQTELAHIGDEIIRIVRDGGERYNEIAVVIPDKNEYKGAIEDAFGKRNIPYFLDVQRQIKDNSVIRFILRLVNIASRGLQTQSVLSLLSTGIFTNKEKAGFFSDDERAYLEKYCIRFNVRKNEWQKPFEFGREYYDLDKLNASREKLIDLLLPFVNSVGEASTAAELCDVLEKYFETFGLDGIIQDKMMYLRQTGQNEAALEYSGIRGAVADCFGQIRTFMGDVRTTTDEFGDILSESFENMTVSIIPACIDNVLITESGRMMAKHIKALFVAGSDGISMGDESGLFNMSELDMLKAHNIDIGADSTKRISDEQYYIYRILTKPTEKLFISYVKQKETEHSNAVCDAVRNVFGKYTPEATGEAYPPLLDSVDNIGNALDAALMAKTELCPEGDKFLIIDGLLRKNSNGLYDKLCRAADSGREYSLTTDLLGSGVMLKLENGKYTVDVSRIEKYKSCPYKYFVDYCIRPEKTHEGAVKQFDVGNIIHAIIEEFTKTVLIKDNPTKEDAVQFAETRLDAIIQGYTNGKTADNDENRYIISRIKRLTAKITDNLIERRNRSKMEIYGTEIEFDDNPKSLKSFSAIHCKTEDGDFYVHGKIDCVEYFDTEDNRFWIVNDYKTGTVPDNADIRLNNNIQLPVYMCAILADKKNTRPGALFYVGVGDGKVKADNEEELKKNRMVRYGKQGIILADDRLIEAVDREEAGSKKKLSKYNDVVQVDDDALDGIIASAKQNVCDTFTDINDGCITKLARKKTDCDRCEYRRFCNYDASLKNTDQRHSEGAEPCNGEEK